MDKEIWRKLIEIIEAENREPDLSIMIEKIVREWLADYDQKLRAEFV